MKVAPIPDDEAARLRALWEYRVLDTPPEPGFDALTELAAAVLEVPISLVCLVDAERQWFKSHFGLDATETGRDISFCGHVVASKVPMVIGDARADARFADNPLVTGAPHIRFYAGMPLYSPDGLPLGTLCVIDRRPRLLNPQESRALETLAAQAQTLLELRRHAAMLETQRQKLEVFASFFEHHLDLCCTVDDSFHVRELNPAWTKTLGWSLDELRARPLLELVHPEDQASTRAQAARLLAGETATNFENRYQHKDGRWVPLSWTARVVGGLFFATAHDLTRRRAQEAANASRDAALAESEAMLRAVFDAMDEGVVVQPPSGPVVAANPAAARILGMTEDQLLGRASLDPRWRAIREDGSDFPAEEHPAMVTRRTGQPLTDVLMGVYKPSGTLSWLSVNSRPLHGAGSPSPGAVVATFRDVTRQRELAARSERLAQQEKLITTGTLAAGVGHEINNPLSFLLGNLEFAIEELCDLGGGTPLGRMKQLHELLLQARGGAERVRRIVRGLRALARDDGPAVPTNVVTTTEIALHMAMHELRQNARVQVMFPEHPPLPHVLADESRLTQVLVNLLVNAAQAFAVPEPSRNLVTISATVETDHLVLAVVDNGPGIPAEALPRIFDPFFTTKPVGQGTGLGLSISHSIVTALGGELRCESTPGQGAQFFVKLPLAPESQPLAAPADPALPPEGGRVLLIDDNEKVLHSMARLLGREHEVIVESDPRAAVTRLESGERFDVVFCDVMMPRLTGREVFERAWQLDHDQARRFVFMTGGVGRADLDQFLSGVSNEQLEKPIGVQLLRNTVRRFTSGRGAPSIPK